MPEHGQRARFPKATRYGLSGKAFGLDKMPPINKMTALLR